MKKIISLMLFALMLVSLMPSALADRREDKSEPIDNFHVYKWISNSASNEVAVLTVNAGERGYVVISVTSEENYEKALDVARSLLATEPTELNGTPFAYLRAKV